MKNLNLNGEIPPQGGPGAVTARVGFSKAYAGTAKFLLAVSLAGGAGAPLSSAGAAPTTAVWLSPAAVLSVDYEIGSDTGVNVGYWVEPSVNVTVTQLGLYDHLGEGFAGSAAVGIFDSAHQLLASVDMPAGTVAPLRDGFRWVAIPPLTLVAGQAYFIDAIPEVNPVAYTVSYSQVTLTSPEITLQPGSTHFVYAGPGLHFPTMSVGYASILGPSFAIERDTPEGTSGTTQDGDVRAQVAGSGPTRVHIPRRWITRRGATGPGMPPAVNQH